MLKHTSEYARMVKFLQLVRKHVDEDCTVKSLITLLGIAVEPGIDQTTLGTRLDISRSTVSKNIQDLSALTSKKVAGPGLVENRVDPMRLNIRLPALTKKGEQVLQKIGTDTWNGK